MRETRSMSEAPRKYPFITWDRFLRAFIWLQGQHVLVVGGSGSGKTTLAGALLLRRSHVVVCVSKGMDPTFAKPPYSEFVTYRDWPPKHQDRRVMLWPDKGKDIIETREKKKRVFMKAFDSILLHEGGWCIDIDELHYMADSLRLEPQITDLEEQGRSAGITIWGNTQRPASIPLACYTNAMHAFFYLTQEDYDVRRLGSIRNRHTNPKELMANIERLQPHECVYIDRTGRVPPIRTRVDLKARKVA